MYLVYFIYSGKWQRYYVGSTNNYIDRLERHNQGRNKYTKSGVPWDSIHTIECINRSEAVRLEKKIKKRGISRYLNDNDIRGVAQSG